MTTVFILMMLLGSFIAARMYKSTKMWWAYMLAIAVGLLMGIVSNDVMESKNDSITYTQTISTGDNELMIVDMQSLVATVTEGTTTAFPGLQVIATTDSPLSDALIVQYTLKGRDSPFINDTS